MAASGYKRVEVRRDGKRVRQTVEHRLVAEKALGKPLPLHAVVHHVDGDRRSNAPSNLVICENQAYHNLLHQRQRAYEATGDANAVRCERCGHWVKSDDTHQTCRWAGTKRRALFLGICTYDPRRLFDKPPRGLADSDKSIIVPE